VWIMTRVLSTIGTVAQNLEKKVTTEHLWCGRHVKVIDGSTVLCLTQKPCIVWWTSQNPFPSSSRAYSLVHDLLVLVSPLGKTSVDAVFICVDECRSVLVL